MIGLNDIVAARERIHDAVVMTPLVPSPSLSDRLQCDLHLKMESLQRTGSFKDRGALNRMLALSPEERSRGVVTASAGNHAQAVAYHGSKLGIPVEVVMPEHTPLIKVSSTRRYGAGVTFHGVTLSDSMVEARRIEKDEQRTLIHAYDDELVIAGQGTIGLEIVEKLPDVSVVVVPIGGGGLISGIAIAIKEKNPAVRIIGVEAAAAASALASRKAGHVVSIETSETIADGIAVKAPGGHTFPIIQRYVDDIVSVDEEEIAESVHILLERQKILVEGAGATPLAALLAGKIELRPDDVAAMIISGGNIDLNLVERIINRGMVSDGRLARLTVAVPDRPGQLARLTQLVAECGANVLEVTHGRAFAEISMRDVEIDIDLETRGREHVEELLATLESHGFGVRQRA
jgi:threonine dehydratase